MMYVLNSPSFQNFISIYGQNSVKILINPYIYLEAMKSAWHNCARVHMNATLVYNLLSSKFISLH